MKKLVKDSLEAIVGEKINNEHHAEILLEQKLKNLGGGMYVEITDGIPMLLDFIKIYDPSIEQYLTPAFWNTLVLATSPKRIGKLLRPKEKKMDKDILTPLAESITQMHSNLKFDFNQKGVVFLTQDNLTACTARKWMLIEGPVREFSAEVVFNQIKDLNILREIVPDRYLDGKSIQLLEKEDSKSSIKYLTITELIDIFTSNTLVERICLKTG